MLFRGNVMVKKISWIPRTALTLCGVDLWDWIEGTIEKIEKRGFLTSETWNDAWEQTYFELGGKSSSSASKGCPKKGAYTLFYLGRIAGTKRPYLDWNYQRIRTELSKNGVYAVMAIDILKEQPGLNLTALWSKIQKKYRKEFDDEPASSNQGGPTVAYKLFRNNKIKFNKEKGLVIPTKRKIKRVPIGPIEKDEITNKCKEIHKFVERLPVYNFRTPRSKLPRNGVYFFYENGEVYQFDGEVHRRIVRVGTHRSQDRFRSRIYQHFMGNKNSSVFRKHLGGALIRKMEPNDPRLHQWLKQDTPTFPEIEEEVSKVLREHFSFNCITVEDKEERQDLEERIIATLAYDCKPSPNWLGHHSASEEIRASGLWNVEHTDSPKILTLQDLSRFKKLVSRQIANTISTTEISVGREVTRPQVVCFIPCCKSKFASGHIVKEGRGLTKEDLPNTWNSLIRGRNGMHRIAEEVENIYIDPNSPKTTAIYLYTGAMYCQFYNLNDILQNIQEGRLRLFVISAWYGVVDAFEPLHKYEAKMQGRVATHWRNFRLDEIISDLLLALKPSHVFGFFAGDPQWSGPAAKYRYFFTAGLKDALRRDLNTRLSGCFYRISGYGAPAILGALGRTFAKFVRSDFSEEFVVDIERNRRIDENVVIGFERIQ